MNPGKTRSTISTSAHGAIWRAIAARSAGAEGPNALMRLPWLMEEIFEAWDVARKRPQFKAEYMITHNIVGALENTARASTKRGVSARRRQAH